MTPRSHRFGSTLSILLVFFWAGNFIDLIVAQVTIDWIYSDASAELTAVPQFSWLDDGTAILLDPRKPEGERTFEILDPAGPSRRPALDMSKAVASLARFRDAAEELTVLPWPISFDRHGRRAVYLFDEDIFLLDVNQAEFIRITETEAEEKSLQFSPDGTHVSYVRDNDLYIFDVSRDRETQLTLAGSEDILNGTLSWVYWEEVFGRRDIGYWWSPDSKAIAYLQTDESGVALTHFVDFKPTVPRLIKQRYPKAGGANPTVRLGIRGLDDSETRWLTLPEYEYLVRVHWLPGSQKLTVQTMNRSQDVLDLFLVQRRSAQVQRLLRETDQGWVNINDDLYFLKDGKGFVWQSERDGYAHLYHFSSNGQLVNQITRGEWALRSSGRPFWLRRSVSAIDEERGWIYFTALEKSSIERHLYRIDFDGAGMKRISAQDGVHSISFSPDANYYLDTFSNTSQPPSLSLYRNDGSLLETLAEPRVDIAEGLEMIAPELFTIPTADGFPMPAEILKPANFDPSTRYPLIYHVYGGPSAPTVFNSWNSDRYFDQILVSNGFLVVRFDHRSAAAISKKLENRLLNLMSGPIEMQDIVDGIRWLKSRPWVDENRVGIWGWSGGGSFTLNAMTNTREFKAGIAVAPVTDWHYYDTKWAEFAMKRPEENPSGYDKTSFVKSAKNLHGRLLLVHGTYDDNVHPQNSWAFIEELVQANIQFEMMFYPMRSTCLAPSF